MNPSTTINSNYRPYSRLCKILIESSPLPKLSQEKKERITKEAKEAIDRITQKLTEVASFKKETLLNFIILNRKDLSYFAIKRPSDWLLFSQSMLHIFPTSCDGAKLLKKLNHELKDLDRMQSQNTFFQVLPKELRLHIAFSSPPLYKKISSVLEKMRLTLLEDIAPPYDSLSEVKSLPINELANWISTHNICLQTLEITSTKIQLMLPKLRFLNLKGYPKDEISDLLKNMKDVFHLSCDQMTDSLIETLVPFKSLKSLDLSDSEELTDYGIAFLEALNLVQLNISNCTQITDASISQITIFENLERFEMRGNSKVTDEGIKNLSLLTKLSYLDLSNCTQLTGKGLQVENAFNQLTHLDLSYCNISEEDLEILSQFTNLKTLKLVGCENITPEGLQVLKRLPKLESLIIEHESIIKNWISILSAQEIQVLSYSHRECILLG